jgi:hypothetical protein
MYYLKISEEDSNKIMYFCRKCGDKDDSIINNEESLCISKTHIKKTTEVYKNVINEFTKLDSTLPRIKNMLCPNVDCKSNNKKEDEEKGEENKFPEIIYLRYDNNNMKYVYLCCECDHTWTN